MKILMVNRFATLDRVGGTYRYIDDLSRELARRGHEVHLLCKREGAFSGRFEQQLTTGYWIHQFGVPRHDPFRNTWLYMRMIRQIAEELDQRLHFDVVGLHDAQMGGLLKKSAICQHAPLVCFFHAPVFYEFAYKQRFERAKLPVGPRLIDWLYSETASRLQWLVEYIVLSQADSILTLSQFSVSLLHRFFSRRIADKAMTIPGGVDIQRFYPTDDQQSIRQRLRLPQNATILFTVRNLMPRMGLDNLVAAMRLVTDQLQGEELLLCIGGKGPLRATLEELVRDLGLESSVRLLGFVADEDLPAYYQAADFFVLPTVALEGFGIVTIEALACNTPVIGTPIGATPEILKQVGGFLSKSASPDDLAEEIISVLQQKGYILKHWQSRRVVEAKYSWAAVGSQIEDLFKAVTTSCS